MTFTHGSEPDRAKNVRDSVAEQINRISCGLYTNGHRHETQSNDSTIPCQPAPAKMTCLVQLVLLLHDIRRSLLQFNISSLRRLQRYGIFTGSTLPITLLYCSALQSADTKLSGLWDMGAMKRLVKRHLVQSTLEEISLELSNRTKVCSTHEFHEFHGIHKGSCGFVRLPKASWSVMRDITGAVRDSSVDL